MMKVESVGKEIAEQNGSTICLDSLKVIIHWHKIRLNLEKDWLLSIARVRAHFDSQIVVSSHVSADTTLRESRLIDNSKRGSTVESQVSSKYCL